MVAAKVLTQIEFNLGPASRIPVGEGRAFRVGTLEVAVFRTRTGEVYATQAACPHKEGPLAEGIVGAGKVICPLHGYAFSLITGRQPADACEPLRVFSVTISEDGDILISP